MKCFNITWIPFRRYSPSILLREVAAKFNGWENLSENARTFQANQDSFCFHKKRSLDSSSREIRTTKLMGMSLWKSFQPRIEKVRCIFCVSRWVYVHVQGWKKTFARLDFSKIAITSNRENGHWNFNATIFNELVVRILCFFCCFFFFVLFFFSLTLHSL